MSAHPSLINARPDASRSSVAVFLGLFSTTAFGALQAVVLVAIIGNGFKTDAFLAAYSLYYALVIVAASVRAPFVKALGAIENDDTLRIEASALISRSVTLSLAIGVLLTAASPFAGMLVAQGGGQESQNIAIYSLLILVPAGVMQMYATSTAAILNAARRFSLSALLYGIASFVAIVASVVLLELVGVLGAPLGLLIGAIVLAGGHCVYLRRFGVRSQPRLRQLREAVTRKLMADVLANASLGMSIQLALTIALAAVGSLHRAGLVTDYSYGYFIVIAMTGFTSLALNTVILPDVVAEASRRGLAGVRDRIVALAPFSFGVVVPIIAGLIAFGEPLLRWAAAPLLSPGDIATVFDIAMIFTIAAASQILLQNGATAVISMGRWNLLWVVSLASLAAQGAAVWSIANQGANAIAWAHAIVTAAAAVVLIGGLFREQAVAVLLGSLKPLLRLAPCAVGFPAFRLLLGDDSSILENIGALVGSTVLYTVLVMTFVPVLRQAFGSLLSGRTAPT